MGSLLRRVAALLERWRYAVLTAMVLASFTERFVRVEHAYYHDRVVNDWTFFEFGGRVLVHYNAHYPGGAHVYADYPWLQIGPPPLLLVGAFQWLSPKAATLLLGLLMALAGVLVVAAAEQAARRLAPAWSRLGAATLVGGSALMLAWGNGVGRFRHLDDVIALAAAMVAAALVARGRPWWLAAALLGLAAASKPWAIVLAPLLLGLPRADRAKAALVTMASCAVWWLPFVLVDSRTVAALGQYTPWVSHGSVLSVLGLSGITPLWVHPVQTLAGLLVALYVGARGRWTAVPLAALAARVLIDTQAWSYYGMSLLAAALLHDLAGRQPGPAVLDGLPGRLPDRLPDWWPAWTLGTALAWYGPPLVLPGASGAVRLTWAVTALAATLATARRQPAGTAPAIGRPVPAPVLEPTA